MHWIKQWLLVLVVFLCGNAWAMEPDGTVSLLEPDTSLKTQFTIHYDALNPSPETNPKGTDAPGYRAPNQLVVYTRGFGSTTQTNTFGEEAIVVDGHMDRFNKSNSDIPYNGFVISGHGQSGQWVKRVLKPGAAVSLDTARQEITVQLTPEVYQRQVDTALKQAESAATNTLDDTYTSYLAQARVCRRELGQLAPQGVTQTMVDVAQHCEKLANKAFYRSIPSNPHEFRGVWVRPVEQSPEAVQRAVAELKAANIRHIFLETYYQGRTIYPSKVMAEYGLPKQHTAFEGKDPLALWLEAAKAQDIKVHVWVQTLFAGNRNAGPEAYGPILEKYPQWANVQFQALTATHPKPSAIEEGHFFLDPANPEVRVFLEKLMLELVTQYPVDGLNLDYIRYPASHPVTNPQFLASSWGYTLVARQAFQQMIEQEAAEAEAKRIGALKKAGKPIPKPKPKKKEDLPKLDPKDFALTDPLWPRWVDWRKEQVSSLVKSLKEKTQAVKPNLLVSAVVFPQSDAKNLVKLQDWPRWVNEGWIEALTPIGLKATPEGMYQDSLAFKQMTQGKVPVYVGVFGMYNRNTPADFLSQIHAVHRAGLPGVVLFERSRLTEEYREALLEGAFRN